MDEWAPLTDEEFERMLDDDFVMNALGTGPTSWKWHARSLKNAADVVLDRYRPAITKLSSMMGGRMNVPEEEWYERDARLISAYYLLVGLAIENLAKGIIMAMHPEYLKNNMEINKEKLRTHDVYYLLETNNICGFDKDKALLNALTTCVVWMSRYPLPFKRENFSWGSNWMDPVDIENLYKRLYDKLDDLAK